MFTLSRFFWSVENSQNLYSNSCFSCVAISAAVMGRVDSPSKTLTAW